MSERETRTVRLGDLEVEECAHCGTLEFVHDDTYMGARCNLTRALHNLWDALGEGFIGSRRWARLKVITDTTDTPNMGG